MELPGGAADRRDVARLMIPSYFVPRAGIGDRSPRGAAVGLDQVGADGRGRPGSRCRHARRLDGRLDDHAGDRHRVGRPRRPGDPQDLGVADDRGEGVDDVMADAGSRPAPGCCSSPGSCSSIRRLPGSRPEPRLRSRSTMDRVRSPTRRARRGASRWPGSIAGRWSRCWRGSARSRTSTRSRPCRRGCSSTRCRPPTRGSTSSSSPATCAATSTWTPSQVGLATAGRAAPGPADRDPLGRLRTGPSRWSSGASTCRWGRLDWRDVAGGARGRGSTAFLRSRPRRAASCRPGPP